CEKLSNDNDTFINFFVNYNRNDMRSWWGIAKEISIILNINLNNELLNESYKNYSTVEWGENTELSLKIKKKKENNSIKSNQKTLLKNIFSLIKSETGYHFIIKKFSDDDIIIKIMKSSSVLEEDFLLVLLRDKLKKIFNIFDFNLLTKKRYLKVIKEISITKNYIEKKIGAEIEDYKIVEFLKRLNFRFTKIKNSYLISIPHYRKDIKLKEDIIEEIGRLLNYNKIPNLMKLPINDFLDDELMSIGNYIRKNIAMYLASNGFQEVLTYSLVDKKSIIDDEYCLKILNPTSSEHNFYRNFIFPSHIKTFKLNSRNKIDNFLIFENSKIYFNENKIEPKPKYKELLSIFAACNAVNSKDLAEEKISLAWIKSIMDNISLILNLENPLKYESNTNSFLQKGSDIFFKEQKIGFLGELSKSLTENKNCLTCEIDLGTLIKEHISFSKKPKIYREFSKSQIIKRDISFFISKRIAMDDVTDLIRESFKEMFLFNLKIIDIYNKKDDLKKHSLCYSIEFLNSSNNQLINKKIKSVLKSLNDKFEIEER
ncbi:MAG TPA: hypothetical protein VN854_00875, partial [Mycoplasmatales bacterium]|nr:hypothetical protein [Mycoplasmatales bacterium]